MQYQYYGTEYTKIRLVEGEEKQKVVQGEIIESDLPEKYFTSNQFRKVEINTKVINDGNSEITLVIKNSNTKKKK